MCVGVCHSVCYKLIFLDTLPLCWMSSKPLLNKISFLNDAILRQQPNGVLLSGLNNVMSFTSRVVQGSIPLL